MGFPTSFLVFKTWHRALPRATSWWFSLWGVRPKAASGHRPPIPYFPLPASGRRHHFFSSPVASWVRYALMKPSRSPHPARRGRAGTPAWDSNGRAEPAHFKVLLRRTLGRRAAAGDGRPGRSLLQLAGGQLGQVCVDEAVQIAAPPRAGDARGPRMGLKWSGRARPFQGPASQDAWTPRRGGRWTAGTLTSSARRWPAGSGTR